MIVHAYDYFLIVWFVLAGLSTTYVAYDQFRNNPEPTVMRWGFVLVTLYMGPFGPWRANVTGRRCFVRAGAVFQVPFLLQRAGTLLVRGLKGAGSGVDEPCPAGHGSPFRAPGAPGLPRPGPARAPHLRDSAPAASGRSRPDFSIPANFINRDVQNTWQAAGPASRRRGCRGRTIFGRKGLA